MVNWVSPAETVTLPWTLTSPPNLPQQIDPNKSNFTSCFFLVVLENEWNSVNGKIKI